MASVHTMKRLSDRSFGLALAAFFAILAAIGWLLFDAVMVWAVVVAAVFLVLSVALPDALLPVNYLWHAFAFRLGHATNTIVLALFFFLLVMPLGLILRLFGWDPMFMKRNPGVESYFTEVRRHTSAETLPDMF